MIRWALAAALLSGPASAQTPSPPDTWQPRTTAELSALDKVRAQPATLTARVGQSVTFGTLTITVRGCFARPPDVPQDSTAFLEIADSRPTGAGFRGWMIANAPSLSQFEHPLYDIRVMACR